MACLIRVLRTLCTMRCLTLQRMSGQGKGEGSRLRWPRSVLWPLDLSWQFWVPAVCWLAWKLCQACHENTVFTSEHETVELKGESRLWVPADLSVSILMFGLVKGPGVTPRTLACYNISEVPFHPFSFLLGFPYCPLPGDFLC